MKFLFFLMLMVSFGFLTGCQSVYNIDNRKTYGEGTMVFVRPKHYTILGTTSIRDHLEITYEQLTILSNGYAKLELGIRNRGGQHWWHSSGDRVQLTATPYFYANSIDSSSSQGGVSFPSDLKAQDSKIQGPSGAPLYCGARTPVSIGLGETKHLSFLAPVKGIRGYQVVFAEE